MKRSLVFIFWWFSLIYIGTIVTVIITLMTNTIIYYISCFIVGYIVMYPLKAIMDLYDKGEEYSKQEKFKN